MQFLDSSIPRGMKFSEELPSLVGVDAFYACFETFRRHYVALYSLKHKEIHTFHCKNGLVVELELCKKMSKGVFMKNVKIKELGKERFQKNSAAYKDS